MRRHSEYFELVLVVFVAVLTYLFQPIFEHLFAGALLMWLENYMGISEAEIIARLSGFALPIAGSILGIGALYRYLERELRREFADEDARLKMRLAVLRTEGVALRDF